MSLVECCISVAIVAAGAMAVMPSLTGARKTYELEAAARQIAGQLQKTRIRAVSRNEDCRIRVTSETSYIIECQDPLWRIDESVALQKGFRMTATASPEFHHRGNVSPSATITVWDSGGRSKSVIVNITGRVRLQ
jgi:type II secretory pathway pseudopilin PulG